MFVSKERVSYNHNLQLSRRLTHSASYVVRWVIGSKLDPTLHHNSRCKKLVPSTVRSGAEKNWVCGGIPRHIHIHIQLGLTDKGCAIKNRCLSVGILSIKGNGILTKSPLLYIVLSPLLRYCKSPYTNKKTHL